MVPARLACMVKIDSVEALIRAVQAGARIKYLHFWGHRPRPDGQLSASCLSQWWPSRFVADGVEYATAEHWMMAGKARLFGDAEAESRVLAAAHPAEAKKAGRLVRGFDEAIWERERFDIVARGSVHKFASSPRRTCGSSCWGPATGYWWRRARWTGCGGSAWRRRTRGRRIRSGGGG